MFARASGAGKAGVAVFRISGPAAFSAAAALCGRLPEPNRTVLRPIRNAYGDLIDKGLVILFRGPSSFTGEDVAELHLHGSAAVESALFDALLSSRCRPAEAGEFTRRALINGKLDLAEVEGLGDLLEAETDLQRKQALGQFVGRLSAVAEGWRARLVAIAAPLEAEIDFPDEGGVPADIAARAGPEIDALLAELERVRIGASRTRVAREGVKVVIIGAPNAGKSSLLNALAGSDRAIVSDIPGTTRDVIEARLDLGGTLVSLFDTAGLREATADLIESEGIRRTRMKAEQADLRLLMIDVSRETSGGMADRETQPEVAAFDEYGLLRDGDLVILNKIDLAPLPIPSANVSRETIALSARTGEGVEALIARLTAIAASLSGAGDGDGLSRLRHVVAVDTAATHLAAARERLGSDPELAAEDIRLAARALGAITGAVGVEDVLGAIFSSFCIGK
ncbi:MAG: tRNA uridine-5-carboxymethylaminomethyl(34) synthesis GTPase MnmE [Parvularculaceae bacterium]